VSPTELDTAWEAAWREEHRWDGRGISLPWGAPMIPPRPPLWEPGVSTELAWLRQVVYR
jgi:hypothetical protein